MFYYWINENNEIEFIFFDYMMKNVTFGEAYIRKKRDNVSK